MTAKKNEKTTDLRKEFSELPLDRKIATLTQLELDTAKQAFNTIADESAALGKKLFDGIFGDCERKDQEKPEAATE